MNREELHELVTLLKNALASGRIKIPSASPVRTSLEAVRLGADGKVDPNTVDGWVRAAALAAAGAQEDRERKKTPLREVQREYFDILDLYLCSAILRDENTWCDSCGDRGPHGFAGQCRARLSD